MPDTGRNRTDSKKNLVGFVVGGVSYAVDIDRVRAIINPQEVTPLPLTPPEVAGVADHRGQVVPIIDLRVRFGLSIEETARGTKWILLNAGADRVVAIVVDAVTVVFGAGEGMRPTPDVGGASDVRGIAGVVNQGGKLTFVLDTARFIALADALASSGVL